MTSYPAKRSEAAIEVHKAISELAPNDPANEVITAVHRFPAREAQWAPMPEWWAGTRASLSRQGHRAALLAPGGSGGAGAARRQHGDCDSDSVGKTLCYNLPVLNAVLANPDTRALYIFPTKALAQDQLAELQDLGGRLGDPFGVFTYDGDTPSDARQSIRQHGHIVLTNPDMLHTGVLPHHTKWTRLFENLQYIVIDELHTYRGVFGSHLANVLRRLRRISRFYGREPQFIFSSATIANPGELAGKLIGADVEVIPVTARLLPKNILLLQSAGRKQVLGIRRCYINETWRITRQFLRRGLQAIVFANSRLIPKSFSPT